VAELDETSLQHKGQSKLTRNNQQMQAKTRNNKQSKNFLTKAGKKLSTNLLL